MAGTDAIGSERLEALLAGDSPRTAAEVRRAQLLVELRGGPGHAPEALRTRVLEQRPARARLPRPLRSFRPRALVLAAAVVAVGFAAAAVHGVVSPQTRAAAVPGSTAEQAAPTVTPPTAGSAPARQAVPATQGSRRASRMVGSALRFLALECLVAGAVLVIAATVFGLVRVRRSRAERLLLGSGASPPRGRGDLME